MPAKFPWWVPLGGLLIAAAFAPTLTAPFDFIDDGNLVYPAPAGTTVAGHLGRWWEKVEANYEHLGPFRPTLWAHWELFATATGGDPAAWRGIRLLFCFLSATALLWLLREFRVPPPAALVAAAAALWNPYRSEIWTSLTLAEGVAMPYALLALIAARKAAASTAPRPWEVIAVAAALVALGCKNTYAALLPVQVVLRLWPDREPLAAAARAHGARAALLLLPVLLPAAHFAYFKLHWHPGQYETQGPTVAQAGRILNGLKGGMGLDFLGVGIVATLGAIAATSPRPAVRGLCADYRVPLTAAGLLVLCGSLAYLPMGMMSGRYTMPGIWGLDILFAVALAALGTVPRTAHRRGAWAAVCVGLAVLSAVNTGRQEKVAARARMLWAALEYVEARAPQGGTVVWVSGDAAAGELNAEEGIHFRWHLLHRGRGDIHVRLVDRAGNDVPRVELPPATGPVAFVVAGNGIPPALGDAVRSFDADYWFGRKHYSCGIGVPQ